MLPLEPSCLTSACGPVVPEMQQNLSIGIEACQGQLLLCTWSAMPGRQRRVNIEV